MTRPPLAYLEYLGFILLYLNPQKQTPKSFPALQKGNDRLKESPEIKTQTIH